MRITSSITTSSTGMVTSSTRASSGSRTMTMISAPMSMPGARRHMRSSMLTKFISWVTSLVRRVTSEPVEKRSMLAKENLCTFANTSRRRSAAKLTAARAPKYAPPTPPSIMMTLESTISAQISTMWPMSRPSTPVLMMLAYRLGRITSPSTSTIMHSGPRTKYFQ